ncbi:MAG TPA: hypothetical protein VLV48_01405 [Thermoanaerobaculia bacterium]|nr:hypothetical protein [Thermoanaerobaculia bacterium]
MRTLVHAVLILAMAAVIPASAMAAYCGGSEMRCCAKGERSDLSLSRPDCCTSPCIEAQSDPREPASETRPFRLSAPDAGADFAPAAVALTPDLAYGKAAPAISPPLSRRLASLATLLI